MAEYQKEQEKQRTIQQNKALHLYFSLLADAFNEAGLDMKAVLKPSVDIPWSKDSVKEFIWKPIQELQVGKKSTTQLNTKEIDKIWETINRHIAEKFGITEPFPSIEEILLQQDEQDTGIIK